MSDNVGAVGTIAAMGLVYWLAYGIATALAVAAIGFFVVALAGVVGFVYYIVSIGRCVRRRDADGAIALISVPGLLAGVSLLATLFWWYSGQSFTTSIAAKLVDGPDTALGNVLIFPFGVIAVFGWLLPLAMAHGYVNDPGGRPDGFWYKGCMFTLATIWGIVGGSSFVIPMLATKSG